MGVTSGDRRPTVVQQSRRGENVSSGAKALLVRHGVVDVGVEARRPTDGVIGTRSSGGGGAAVEAGYAVQRAGFGWRHILHEMYLWFRVDFLIRSYFQYGEEDNQAKEVVSHS